MSTLFSASPAPFPFGAPIPNHPHAVSVSMPRWQDVKGYEEDDAAIVAALDGGYPRFRLSNKYRQLHETLAHQIPAGRACLVLPSLDVAKMFGSLARAKGGVDYVLAELDNSLALVHVPQDWADLLRLFRQSGGHILSSRLAEAAMQGQPPHFDGAHHDHLRADLARLYDARPEDVFLYPTGAAAAHALHRAVAAERGTETLQIGLPYLDTWQVQLHFGDGARFVRFDGARHMPDVFNAFDRGRISAVFTETPSNPHNIMADTEIVGGRLRKKGAPFFIDDTLGAANLRIPGGVTGIFVSLTKYYSGLGDVMGGAAILTEDANRNHPWLREEMSKIPQTLYAGDAEVLAHNGKGFAERMRAISANGLAAAEFLRGEDFFRKIHHTGRNETYRRLMKPGAGHGGLISVEAADPDLAPAFYNNLNFLKGPSLGMQDTLACLYPWLAHYKEFGWLQRNTDVRPHEVRLSIGCEPIGDIKDCILEAIARTRAEPQQHSFYYHPTEGVMVSPR